MHRSLGIISAALLSIAIWTGVLQAREVPDLTGRVVDNAGVLSQQGKQQIEAVSAALEASDSTQVVVLTIDSLEDDDLEGFSIKVAEKWKIGHKGLDNGVILLVAKKEHKVRVEVGRGLEGKLTDLMSGRIIANAQPIFKAGDFDKALLGMTQDVGKVVKGEFKVSDLAKKKKKPLSTLQIILIVILVIICVLILAAGMRSGFGYYGGGWSGGGGGSSGGDDGWSGGGGGFGGGGASGEF